MTNEIKAQEINITEQMEIDLFNKVKSYGTIGCKDDVQGELNKRIARNLGLNIVVRNKNNSMIIMLSNKKNHLRKKHKTCNNFKSGDYAIDKDGIVWYSIGEPFQNQLLDTIVTIYECENYMGNKGMWVETNGKLISLNP